MSYFFFLFIFVVRFLLQPHTHTNIPPSPHWTVVQQLGLTRERTDWLDLELNDLNPAVVPRKNSPDSMTSTNLPTCKFSEDWCHLGLDCNSLRYYRVHCFQNFVWRVWMRFHLEQTVMESWLSWTFGRLGRGEPMRNWPFLN